MVEIRISQLSDASGFLQCWSSIYERADAPGFFLSPAWMAAWLRGVPAGTKLHQIIAYEGARPVMISAVGIGARRPRLLGMREARLHEFGDPEHDAIYIEYNELLCAHGIDDGARREMILAIISEFRSVDNFIFRNIRTGLSEILPEIAAAQSLKFITLLEQPGYVKNLKAVRENGGDFIASLGKSLRAKTRRALRRYEERGAISYRKAETQQEWDDDWKMMVELHGARWRERGKAGAFANSKVIAFHKELRRQAPEAVELFRVYAGESTIGVLYNFIQGDCVMNYQSGFQYETDNQMTPGYVCHALACQHYLVNGFNSYDMLAGEAEYKKRLGDVSETLTTVALERPTLRNKTKAFVKPFLPARSA